MSEILSDFKTEKVAEIILDKSTQELDRILVVGCGSGLEAAILAQRLNAEVVGIDLGDEYDAEAMKFARLQPGDAMALSFEDASFDFVYSYHTLEHIEQPLLALQEMCRVLKDGGTYWIGTPNRHRILGYIGSKHATFSKKIRYNLVDWKARLTGKFRNECGAHAGFSAAELGAMLNSVFGDCTNVSDAYYAKIYRSKSTLLAFLKALMVTDVVYPSVYFMGKNLPKL